MAKKETSFVLKATRRSYTMTLGFLNGILVTSVCYEAWLRWTNISIGRGESQKVRFTLEKVED